MVTDSLGTTVFVISTLRQRTPRDDTRDRELATASSALVSVKLHTMIIYSIAIL